MNWRPISDTPYSVSNTGLVRANRNGAVLSSSFTKSSRNPRVTLFIEKKRTQWYVSRLVHAAFVGDIPDHMVVTHVDHDYDNNAPSNLKLAVRGNWAKR